MFSANSCGKILGDLGFRQRVRHSVCADAHIFRHSLCQNGHGRRLWKLEEKLTVLGDKSRGCLKEM